MALIIIVGILVLVIAGIASSSKRKEHRELIQNTGQRVVARVTKVKKWSDYRMDGTGHGIFHNYYEITAEWIDPRTHQKYTLTSGERVGSPRYRKGDGIYAYVSPHGAYLDM